MGILDEMVPRREWGARFAAGRLLAWGQKTEMHVHHTVQTCPGPAQCADTLRSIEAQHNRQWGTSIGYNLAWCHGRLFEANGILRRGAHCPNHNTSSVGVAYVGDGRNPLPDGLTHDLRRVWDELSNRRGMRLYLFGHRDHRATACPGDNLYHHVHNRFPDIGTPDPQPPPPPPEPGEPMENRPVVAQGSEGGHARIVQALLVAHAEDLVGNANDFVDGVFGPNSARVLREWQARTGVLVADGVCGPASWRWLTGEPVS